MNKMQNFVVWLDGYLEATGDNINISKTNLIKNKLNGLFEHEAETLSETSKKESLQEMGVKHGFDVKNGFPEFLGGNQFPGRDEDGVNYRC
jgi:hypothetical protein